MVWMTEMAQNNTAEANFRRFVEQIDDEPLRSSFLEWVGGCPERLSRFVVARDPGGSRPILFATSRRRLYRVAPRAGTGEKPTGEAAVGKAVAGADDTKPNARSCAVESVAKTDVAAVGDVSGCPQGRMRVALTSGEAWQLENIVAGRVHDFAQDIRPRVITAADYDSTVRGEFPQLLDPDHAEEVDALRRWMQDGRLSHYEYDDANPAYPKAGK